MITLEEEKNILLTMFTFVLCINKPRVITGIKHDASSSCRVLTGKTRWMLFKGPEREEHLDNNNIRAAAAASEAGFV